MIELKPPSGWGEPRIPQREWAGMAFSKQHYLDHPFFFCCKFGKMLHCRSVGALPSNVAMCRVLAGLAPPYFFSLFAVVKLNDNKKMDRWPWTYRRASYITGSLCSRFLCVCVSFGVGYVCRTSANKWRIERFVFKQSMGGKSINILHAVPANKKTSNL
jgi:hypothetical protein